MSTNRRFTFTITFLALLASAGVVQAARVTVELGDWHGVTLVGALDRWDQDGNHRRPVDQKAKIDAPAVDFKAVNMGGNRWVFDNLPPGKYDLLIMAAGRVRIEGWTYAPVLEFDPFFPADATTEQGVRKFIVDDIKKSRHYENKVVPLYLGGGKKTVRVLVMLIRDKPTSYEEHMKGASTIRHEIWQYTNRYGGWQKEKRTKVLDRILLVVGQLRRWTWLWDPELGGIEVKNRPITVNYRRPRLSGDGKLRGLYPY